MLHRAIDQFTDTHETTKEAKEIFRPVYRLYSGALLDVIYDHFLAIHPGEFTEESLLGFSHQTYSILEQHRKWLPEKFALFFHYMKNQNWLFHYRERWGVARSLEGVVNRASYISDSTQAYHLFEEHYQRLQDIYRQFWDELRPFARQQYEALR